MDFEASPEFQLPNLALDMSLHHHHHLQLQKLLPVSHSSSHREHQNPRIQTLNFTDEDEPQQIGAETEVIGEDGKRKFSTWKRMKWSDDMVKILIMIVHFVDDEVVCEGNDKKKGAGFSGVGQKKGKWKMVSRAMMDKGFNVSPQQCEDKFNDLNKRYKRAVDILGIGNCRRVVENPSLVDKFDHLPPNLREEVKKLISSKHLFFKEMFSYHNNCGGASLHRETNLHQHTSCCSLRDNDHDDSDSGQDSYDSGHDAHEFGSRKMLKTGMEYSDGVQELEADMMHMLQDGNKNATEKREWMRRRLTGLEQQRMNILSQSLELENKRFKWMKFSRKKEIELETEKMMNECLKLENERMVLMLRRKELDLIHHV